ncbi:MAG: LolA family protein [Solirubrobacteraceae bacterium]
MKFLRTASTGRLLVLIGGLIVAIAAGTAIAVAATGNSPVPRAKPLARAVHDALAAAPVKGISADVSFTNNLISSDDLPGETADPLLQGARHGRVWLSDDGRLRIELQGDNGDANLVVNKNSFWVSDPMQNTVYEGTLPGDTSSSGAAKHGSATHAGSAHGIPTVAQIQSHITRLMKSVALGGVATSHPGDVAGRPAYSVSVSPKHSGGLLGRAQLAWDAVTGVPLRIAVYARGNATPVLALTATHISYGQIKDSDLNIAPPSGDKVVKVSTAGSHGMAPLAPHAASGAHARHGHAQVRGVAAVARHVPFTLAAPAALAGLPRQNATLLDWGGKAAALLTYGQGLGGIAVIEQGASSQAAAPRSSGSDHGGLSLPTVSINGATGQELATPLGTVVRFTTGGVAYTVLGSVVPYAAETASRALTKPAP